MTVRHLQSLNLFFLWCASHQKRRMDAPQNQRFSPAVHPTRPNHSQR